MKVLFTKSAWTDYLLWQAADQSTLRRINNLIGDIQRTPFRGIGRPEPLRGDLQGWWSRRIATDHRLVYRVTGSEEEQRIEILACRYHYSRRS
ncbi:MAG TPA: Txe/YoeB family addiction module toxin [Stellaceae bacterium]|jgi:toxin YoeB|nr:Txe/YoeB family addiction module toxin [Stellaceae bacterium]